MMFQRTLLAASLLLLGIGSAIAQPVNLGVIDDGTTDFGRSFGRIFGFGSPIGSFTDYYTFSIATPATATGGTIVLEFGSLDLSLTSLSLSGGSLGNTTLVDDSAGSFSFSNLGIGTYTLAVAGSLNVLPGWAGFAQYTGHISAVSSNSVGSPVPEAETYGMLAIGLAGAFLVSRRKRQLPTAATA